MLQDRLTERAKSVLLLIPKKKTVTTQEIFSAIKEVDGLGSHILTIVPILKLPKTKKIDVNELITEAYYQAMKFQHPYVGTEHLLMSLLSLASPSDLNKVKLEVNRLTLFPNVLKNYDKASNFPLIESFGRDLNKSMIQSYNNVVVDRAEYQSLVSALLLKNSSNVLLVGEKGVGKKSLVNLLAKNINMLDVPPSLAGYHVIEFDLLAFLTSTINKLGIDTGLMSLSVELKNFGKTVLSIKNFQNLFFSTASGITMPMFYSLFKSALADIDVKVVATMSNDLYERIIGENDHILEDFTVVEVSEPSDNQTLKILKTAASNMKEFHNVELSDKVITYLFKKIKNVMTDIKFPQRGVEVLDYVCSYTVLKKNKFPKSYKKLIDKSFGLLVEVDRSVDDKNYSKAINARNQLTKLENSLYAREENIFATKPTAVTQQDVKDALESFMGDIKIKEKDKISDLRGLSTLADRIKKKLIGQDAAVDTTVKTLLRARLGLRSKKRPLGNFLFLGPTGVGKTELAKILAHEFFGDKSLIRLDMSDFAEKHTVARLVGAPPGYVGYGEGGELTTKIENNPKSVVLFDEIEKAHADVLNILLQIMEEGELSDARGHIYDFSKSIIILTSNLGTEILHNKSVGFTESFLDDKDVEKRLGHNLKKILKPELINRFDEVIIFRRLSSEDQHRVLNVLLNEIIESLKNEDIKLNVTNSVKDLLIRIGYSSEYGARSLRRTIERELLDKVAMYLLENSKRPLSLKAITKNDTVVIVAKASNT